MTAHTEVAASTYADEQRAVAVANRATPFDAAAYLAMHRAVHEIVTADEDGGGIYVYTGESTGTPDLQEMWAASDWKNCTPDWINQVKALLAQEKAAADQMSIIPLLQAYNHGMDEVARLDAASLLPEGRGVDYLTDEIAIQHWRRIVHKPHIITSLDEVKAVLSFIKADREQNFEDDYSVELVRAMATFMEGYAPAQAAS